MLDIFQFGLSLVAGFFVLVLLTAIFIGLFSGSSDGFIKQDKNKKNSILKKREQGQYENMSNADNAVAHHGFTLSENGMLYSQHRPSESKG